MALTSINIPSFFESPQNALLDAFNRRDLKAFRFALERLKADPNGIIDERLGVSIFKNILIEPNTGDYIELCIQHGADLYEVNNADRRPPLLYAVDSFSPENLRVLLRNFDRGEVNAKLDDKNCLHLLIQSLKGDNFDQLSECIKVLLEHGVDLNSPDDHSKTPFYCLLKQQQRNPKASELVEFAAANFAVDLHSYRGDEMTAMFRSQNPHLEVPEKIEADLTFDFMRNLLNRGCEAKFATIFRSFKAKNGKNSNFEEQCARLVYEAVKIGSDEVINAMKAEGIDIGRKLDDFVNSPLQLAASYGYHKCLRCLLEGGTKVDRNLLHKILHASYQTPPSPSPKVDHRRCFEVALPHCDVNELDDQKCTALHYAARHRNHAAVVELLRRNAFLGGRNIFGETPLGDVKIETLEEALNDRVSLVQVPQEKEQKELKIAVDLNIFAPPREQGEIESLEAMAENAEIRPLIAHPVVATFIFLKWRRLSPIFYANFAAFSVLMWSFIKYLVMCHTLSESERADSGWFAFFKLVSFVGIFLLIVRETFQFVVSVCAGVNYFRSPINVFEIALIVLALLSQILENSIDDAQLRVLRAFAILCAAFEFLHLFGELPFLSISCNMVILQRVALTFLKSLLLYSVLLVAFTLAFFILFGGGDGGAVENSSDDADEFTNFAYPGIAIIKTFVMLTGEFDAASLSLHSKGAYYCIVFLLFVFVVTIVLFNLLSALAVDDTQKIKAQGELVDLCSRIAVLRKYEKMISSGFWSLKRLESRTNLFPFAMADGVVFVQPNKGFLLTSVAESEASETIEMEEGESEFGCIKGRLKVAKDSRCCALCNRLDGKIGKKLRSILEERQERQLKEDGERAVVSEIQGLRSEIRELKEMIAAKFA